MGENLGHAAGWVRWDRRVMMVAALTAVLPAMPARLVATAQDHPPQTFAQSSMDIAGQWQGTLRDGKLHRRLVLKIAKAEDGWSAAFYSIDQGAEAFAASSVTLNGWAFQASIDELGLTFKGALSADGNKIVGARIQGTNVLPLTLLRATGKAAWKIPAPGPAPKRMAADADLSFRKATVKVDTSGRPDLQAIVLDGHDLVARNASLVDLISYAYEVQATQIVGGPDWLSKTRYDVTATMDQKGEPSHQQLRTMMKKLLADRFQLTYHTDKRYLSAYVLTVAKGGTKLARSGVNRPLPGIHYIPSPRGVTLIVQNGTLEELTTFLQLLILERPVVDQTGLTTRFDFHFTFMPAAGEFYGHLPTLPPATEATEPAPDLFSALRQQLGLELTAEDTFVDVIAIDTVAKPTDN